MLKLVEILQPFELFVLTVSILLQFIDLELYLDHVCDSKSETNL